jgi:hypothetical protein
MCVLVCVCVGVALTSLTSIAHQVRFVQRWSAVEAAAASACSANLSNSSGTRWWLQLMQHCWTRFDFIRGYLSLHVGMDKTAQSRSELVCQRTIGKTS